MLVQKIQVSQLNPATYNPRVDLKPGDPNYEKIKRSIDEFGYIDPVIWNRRTGNVVGGHQRLKVLLEQGAKEVECVIVDFDEKKEKLANIALNKISSEFEFSKLADLILDIDTGDIDLELSGFDLKEIKEMMEWTENDKTEEIIKSLVTPEQVADAKETAEKTTERIAEVINELAEKEPAKLANAEAIIMPKSGRYPVILLDSSTQDLITELQRYADEGIESPLAYLLEKIHPMK